MQSLDQLQARFLAMLAGGAPISFGLSRISTLQSRNIYRGNYTENHIQALADTYEHVVALVGTAYFRQLGLRYLRSHPSRSGDLNFYGEHFSEFLETRLPSAPGGKTLPYLADMARLDWARLKSLTAAGSNPPTLTDLPTLSAQQQAHSRLQLNRSCTLLRSEFPLYSLWCLASGVTTAATLDTGGESVLVCRPGRIVEIQRLDSPTIHLLQLWQSHTLAQSLDELNTCYGSASLPAVFAGLNAFANVFELRTTL